MGPDMVIFDKDGKEISGLGQSNTCLRYIGALSGHYPENVLLRGLVDEVMDSAEDAMMVIMPSMGLKGDEQQKMREGYMSDKLPYWMGKFENRLEENEKRGNKKGYFVGDSMTVADLKCHYSLNFLLGLDHGDGDKLLAPCKRLTAWRKLLTEDKALAKYDLILRQKQKKPKRITKPQSNGLEKQNMEAFKYLYI